MRWCLSWIMSRDLYTREEESESREQPRDAAGNAGSSYRNFMPVLICSVVELRSSVAG
jgi:hypothetical protein